MPKPLHRRTSLRRTRIGVALALAAAAAISGVATASQANADPLPHAWICHPVHGAGELKDGWNLIDPADPSVHIDEAAYAQFLTDGTTPYGKHMVTDSDGTRSDVYATVADGVDPQHATADDVSCPGTEDEVLVEHLSVAQTITTSYDRTYAWTLTKSVDKSDIYLFAPAATGAHSGTATWSVNASATSGDGNYLVSGSVDVTNDGQNDTHFVLTLAPGTTASNVNCGGSGTNEADITMGADVICTYSAPAQLTGDVTATATTDVDAYSDTDTISWGAPTNTYGFNNTITDARVGLNAVPITADTGYSHTFPETFTWAQNPCGNDPETNNASLGSGQTATATVTIHRQCLVFQGDTAWASAAAKTNKYNGLTNGNWATWVKGPSGTWNLYAGQTKAAGSASISANGTVTITLANGFVFAPASSGANVHIQGYASPPSGNPAPGQFAFKKTCTASPCSPGQVTLANYYGIHLAVGKWVPDPTFGP